MTKAIKKVEETTKAKRQVAQPIMSLSDLAKLNKTKEFTTKSQMIRYLAGEGHSTAAIAKTMNIRYQQVRNCLVNHVNQNK